MNEDLKKIKDMYGEKMMQICRRNFSTILDKPGLLFEILSKHIAPTRTLADDIEKNEFENYFREFVFAFVNNKERVLVDTGKSPYELMDEAGYRLFECHTESDIQSFKHYYKSGEELCTFHGDRLDRCRVFFAVKKNVSEIKREDFKVPQREDKYGTSVISIQFSHGLLNTLSIKNRYNHTVDNPDATFFNNLENIIPGLTKSFEKNYRLNIISETNDNYNFLVESLPYTLGYIPLKDEDGNEIETDDKEKVEKKYYRFNLEIDGTYFCENNIIIKDGKVIDDYSKDKGRYIIADNYVIDTHEKTIYPYEAKEEDREKDSFVKSIKEVGEIKNITLQKDNGNRIIKIKYTNGKEVFITIDKTNSIVGYKNEHIDKLHAGFMMNNRKLQKLSVDNVVVIEPGCLFRNMWMEELTLPKAQCLGEYFFANNKCMKKLIVPSALEFGKSVLMKNTALEELVAPALERIGSEVLLDNQSLKKLYLPSVKYVDDYFVYNNTNHWKQIYMPRLIRTGGGVFFHISSVENVNFDSLEEIGMYFLHDEEYLPDIYLPNVITIDEGFMDSNQNMEYFCAPNLEKMSKNCFEKHPRMREEILDCIKNKKPCDVHVCTRMRM